MNDDFNSPVLIAHLFEALRIINSANDSKLKLSQEDIDTLNRIYRHFVFDILGLKEEYENTKSNEALNKVMDMILEIRAKAKTERNFTLSDSIRDQLMAAGIQLKDGKEGSTWKL